MNPRPRKQLDTKTYEGRFAERLKMLRIKAKLTPEQIAEAIGVSATTVYRWESGLRQPQISDLPAIADALGVKARILLPEK